MNKKAIFGWVAYDWANSAVNTIVFTFVFSVYFAKSVYGDETAGSAAWSFAQGCAGLGIALLSPLMGATIDRYGPHKPALRILTMLSVLMTAALFLISPSHEYVLHALILGALLTVAFELLQNVYNSTLPLMAQPADLGKISGIGWGFGYVGSIVSLSVALFMFIGLGDAGGLLGIPKDEALHVRSTMLLTAIWFGIFAVPYFLFCPDAPKGTNNFGSSVAGGFADLRRMVSEARRYPDIWQFLVASALYRDGLATLFAVGGLYAAGTLGMSFSEIMIFAIAINVTSGLGAIGFAFLDRRIGARVTVIASLVALSVIGGCVILTESKAVFIALACLLGIFIGPVQAASRTWLATLAPPDKTATFFGLYALSGKAVAFLGPLTFAAMTTLFDSQRAGMCSIIAFWLAGLLLVYSVKFSKVQA